jgi:hypothetical protein
MDSECKNAKDFISISDMDDNSKKISSSLVNLALQKEENKWVENYFEFDVKNNEELKRVMII